MIVSGNSSEIGPVTVVSIACALLPFRLDHFQ